MATKPEAAETAKAPAKSKKMLIIVVAAVLVLALAAGGGWFYISKQRAAADEGEGEATTSTKAAGPPTFLPLDNMVVNLADPGGEKVAQVGITLEIVDAHGVDTVKVYLPAIRSGILLLISQRTAEELLRREGKEKLALDIWQRHRNHLVGAIQRTMRRLKTARNQSRKSRPKGGMTRIQSELCFFQASLCSDGWLGVQP